MGQLPDKVVWIDGRKWRKLGKRINVAKSYDKVVEVHVLKGHNI